VSAVKNPNKPEQTILPDARRPDDDARRRAADEALRRVKRESAPIGASLVARQGPVAPENGDANGDETDDAVERWGKRIGRGLGGVAIVVLIWQIARTLMAG